MTMTTEENTSETLHISEKAPEVSPRPAVKKTNSAPNPARQFMVLTTEVLNDLPPELQLTMYKKVRAEVDNGTLFGMVHPTEMGTVKVVGSKGGLKGRNVKEVLLKNSAKVRDQLAKMSEATFSEHIIRTCGKGLGSAELAKMGEKLNFDAMVSAARKKKREGEVS